MKQTLFVDKQKGIKINKSFQKFISFVLILAFTVPSPFFLMAQENPQINAGTPSEALSSNEVQAEIPSLGSILDTSVLDEALKSMPNDSEINDSPEIVNEAETIGETDSSFEIKTEESEKGIVDKSLTPEALSFSSESPTASNPTFTYQSTLPKVDKLSGALTQTLSLTVPKGRNSLQPNLGLSYNSQNFEDSVVGYGWNVNIPYIERINRTGTQNLYSETYFTSSISGELASTTTFNEYKPKVEETDSLVYTFSTTTTGGKWTAYDKNGTQYSFGTTTNTHQDNVADTTQVYKWMLEEVRDTNDNFIRFEYYKDAGQIYPYKIYYTGSGSTDGIFLIEFSRESRPDVVTSYKPAFLVQTNYRINQIQAKVNGTWVRQYALAYTTGANTKRSLLQSVTESGQDESGSGTLSLPAVSFEYVNDPISFTNYSGSTQPVVANSSFILADTDGNGLLDQNVSYYNGFQNYKRSNVYLNNNEANGDEFTAQYYYNEYWATTYSGPGGYYPTENGVRYFDINGDGFADVVRSQYSYITSSSTEKIYINNGVYASTSVLSWTDITVATSSLPDFSYTSGGGNATFGSLANLNGDGIVDFEMSTTNTGGPQGSNGAHFGNGAAFIPNASLFSPKFLIPTHGVVDTTAGQLIDINGDGLDDAVYNSGGEIKVCFNTGLAWTSSCDANYTLATTSVDSYGNDLGVRFMDINGDGLLDFVRSFDMPTYSSVAGGVNPPPVGTANNVLLNTGSGWATSTLTVPGVIVQYTVAPGGLYTGSDTYYNEMWDWSGDGLADWNKKKNASNKPDILKKITYPTGGTTNVSYTPTTSQLSNSKPKHVNLPFTIHTVTGLTNNDTNGNSESITYSYENGDFYYNNAYDRKFAGFENITEIRGDVITKDYYYQGNTASTTLGEVVDEVSKIGKVYREDIIEPTTGNLFKRIFYNWDSTAKGNGRNFVALTKTLEQNYDGDSTHKDKGSTYTYDSIGNLIQKIEYGEVTGSTNGTFTDTGTDLASTTISYVASSTVNMYLPSQETTVDQSLSKVRESRYYYDSLGLGSISKGNLTKKENWKDSSNYASTTKTYNNYGLVTQDTDARGKITTHTYDSYNLYISTSTNPLSHVTAYIYDYSSGKIKQVTDPNSRIYQYTFDSFDRLTETKQPDITTPTSLITKTQYVYADNTVPTRIQETNYLNSATSTDRYSYFDGFGRKVQERIEAEGTNTFIVKDRLYNNVGKLSLESLPYFASSTPYASSTLLSALLTSYSYDPLGRVKTVANAVGTTTNLYDDWHTTVTDPRGKPKDFYKDAYDNLTTVIEHNSGAHSTTTYAYNLNKKLTSLTDGAGNVRNFTYDGLGNRLTAQDLHASADGTYGTWTYTYDNTGNVTQQVDPNSQTVNFTYDSLNRQLTEDYTGQTGTEVTYTYDGCGDGKGRMCTASSTASRTSNIYNALGLITEATTTIAGIRYPTNFLYDRLGNQTFIKYPDDSRVGYIYNAAGYLDKVIRKELTDTASSTVISRFDHAPTGQVSLIGYPNNATTTNTYNASALYRLSNKLTTLGSTTTIQQLVYTYDANGNITQIADTSNTNSAKTVLYTYDDLNRLTIASTTSIASGSGYNQTFTYDMIGNLTYKSDVGAYSYASTGYTNPHAATSFALATSTYDNNGNLTQIVSANAPTWYQSTSTSAWSYKKPITIDHTKVSGTSTLVNFPVLFSVTDTDLKYTSFGGKVGKTDGTDICFTSSDGVTKLDHEIEKYASTTGEIASWIRIPSLSTTTDTVLYMFFGNSAATDQSNKTGVWSANYKAVYHLSGTSSVNGLDSTSHVNNMNTTGSPTVQTGRIGGGVGVSSGNSLNKTIDTTIGTTNTVSAWVYGSSFGNQNQSVNVAGGAELITADSPNSGKNTIYGGGFVLGSQLATSTWYYVVTTRNGTGTNTYKSYLNGNLDITTTRTSADSGAYLQIGTNGIKPWDGRVDEVRVSTTTNSADWIKTEYNNQSATSTFYSVGSLASIGSSSWKYRKAIIIDRSKVYGSGNLTNFPIVISTTHSDLKYTSSGGKVEKSDGTDILFTSSDASTKLDHEVEKYVSTSGELIAWVKIPTLSPVNDTVIYMYFGNASSTDQQSVTGVWDSNYRAVYHVPNGTTLSATDSTSYTNNGTINSATASGGRVGGSASFNGTTGYINRNNAATTTVNNWTMEGWIKPAALNVSNIAIYNGNDSGGYGFGVGNGNEATGSKVTGLFGNVTWFDSGYTIGAANTWHHIVFQRKNGSTYFFVNGIKQFNTTSATPAAVQAKLSIGMQYDTGNNVTRYFNGALDELRISDTARSDEWVQTQYNNQNSTSTFYSISPLVTYSNYRATSTYAWDYRNQLTQVVSNNATSTYGYDTGGQRVLMTVGNTTTYYPNKLYNIFGATATKHIFAGSDLIATIQGTSTSAVPYYIHTDHLGSTNVVTTASSTVTQLSDYYPYGAGRLDQTSGSFAEQRKYIGEQYDPTSGLSYLNARYYDGNRGQFLSQDPVFWETKQNLENPQSLNSYAYANGNPITNKDPDGRAVFDLSFGGGGVVIGGYAGVKVDTKGSYQTYFGTTYGPSLGFNFNLNASSGYLNPNQERQDYVTRDFSVVPLVGFNRSKTAIQNPSDPFDFSNNPQVSYNLSLGLTLGVTQGFKTEGKVQSNQQSSSNKPNSSSLNRGISSPAVSGSSRATFQSLSNSLTQLQTALMNYSTSISATTPISKKNN